MTDVTDRLTRLIALADEETPEKQRALAFELCDLLFDWPERYPPATREPFESLLEKILQRLDGTTRRMISGRLATRSETALSLLNAFYFDLPAEAHAAVLARNEKSSAGSKRETEAVDEAVLLADARSRSRREFATAFARALKIPAAIADRILQDETGHGLAIACKGSAITRAAYSALALLALEKGNADLIRRRLSAYDEIPAEAARHLVQSWRRPDAEHVATEVAAA